MLKKRLILLVLLLVLVVVLYNLPRVVINDQEENLAKQRQEKNTTIETTTQAPIAHLLELTEAQRSEIKRLKKKILSTNSEEKYIHLVDSLANCYQRAKSFDSAANYFEKIAEIRHTPMDWEKAGSAYYEAFSTTFDIEKARIKGEKARVYLKKALQSDPKRYDLKVKVALTLISSGDPMKGIMLLKDVVEEDTDNQEALFNLGILSYQTGQFKKAKKRLEKLVAINNDHVQGKYYLASTLKELGDVGEALKLIDQILQNESDIEVLASAESLKEELKR